MIGINSQSFLYRFGPNNLLGITYNIDESYPDEKAEMDGYLYSNYSKELITKIKLHIPYEYRNWDPAKKYWHIGDPFISTIVKVLSNNGLYPPLKSPLFSLIEKTDLDSPVDHIHTEDWSILEGKGPKIILIESDSPKIYYIKYSTKLGTPDKLKKRILTVESKIPLNSEKLLSISIPDPWYSLLYNSEPYTKNDLEIYTEQDRFKKLQDYIDDQMSFITKNNNSVNTIEDKNLHPRLRKIYL